ncbi:MAG: hypothetical protein V1753_05315, partial [Pseudomonadota bacterium]
MVLDCRHVIHAVHVVHNRSNVSIFHACRHCFTHTHTHTHTHTLTPPPEITKKQGISKQIDYGKLPLYFIENKGQVSPEVRYYVNSAGREICLAKDKITFVETRSKEDKDKGFPVQGSGFKGSGLKKEVPEIERSVYSLSLVGMNKKVKVVAEDEQEAKVNYFVGDKSNWRQGIKTFGAVWYKGVYDGIDL